MSILFEKSVCLKLSVIIIMIIFLHTHLRINIMRGYVFIFGYIKLIKDSENIIANRRLFVDYAVVTHKSLTETV